MDGKQKPLQRRFYSELRPGLIAFFTRRVGNKSEAEDLVHDVFLRLATAPEQHPRDAHAYVFQIAANLLRDRARRAGVRDRFVVEEQSDEQLQVDPIDPYRIVAGREALTLFVEALDRLPDRTRQIFLLYRYEQVSRRAIAESFGISVSAVEKHVYRAMAALTEHFGGKR